MNTKALSAAQAANVIPMSTGVLSYEAREERQRYGQVYASVIQSVGIRALPWRQFSMTASRNHSSRRFT